jgi:hypothetical protein
MAQTWNPNRYQVMRVTTLRSQDGLEISIPLGYAEVGAARSPTHLLFLMYKVGLRVWVTGGEIERLLARGDIRPL